MHPENQAEAINLMKQESKEDEKGLKKMRKIEDCLEKINAEKEAKREREMKRKSRITEVNRPLSSSSLQNIANHIMDILFAKGSPMNCKYPQSDAQISSEENRSSSVAYFEAVRFLNEKNNEQRINDVIKVLKTLNDEETKLMARRSALIVKTERITDSQQKENLKSSITESSPIRKQFEEECKSYKEKINVLEKRIKVLTNQQNTSEADDFKNKYKIT